MQMNIHPSSDSGVEKGWISMRFEADASSVAVCLPHEGDHTENESEKQHRQNSHGEPSLF